MRRDHNDQIEGVRLGRKKTSKFDHLILTSSFLKIFQFFSEMNSPHPFYPILISKNNPYGSKKLFLIIFMEGKTKISAFLAFFVLFFCCRIQIYNIFFWIRIRVKISIKVSVGVMYNVHISIRYGCSYFS